MFFRKFALVQMVLIVMVGGAALVPSAVLAQYQQAGVVVDAKGVLEVKTFVDPGGTLTRQRAAAARAALDAKVANYSKLRKVSLNRLEQAIRDNQGNLTDQMRYLAGLLRVRYVFYYPETKDIVIAGPAEGWMTDLSGRVVGITTGRPVVQLQDLVVALRAFPPDGRRTPVIGCSIDPTEEGLANMQRFLRSVGVHATPADTGHIVEGLRTSLGYHTVSVQGVSPRTRFAQILVEADYRMKLIGIGLEQPPVRLVSYVERASPADVRRNAMERWYFVPDYQCVRVSEDRLAMELVGDGVKLIGEGELVTADGQRVGGKSNKASQAFVQAFTKSYPELAERSPVYAELRNLIDLSVAAAYIQQQGLYDKAGWKMELFGNEEAFAVETHNAPRQVATACNAVWKGNQLMTPVGGGVNIQPTEALKDTNLLRDENGSLSKARQEIKLNLAKGQWWWD
jgi:hypothetical protein